MKRKKGGGGQVDPQVGHLGGAVGWNWKNSMSVTSAPAR